MVCSLHNLTLKTKTMKIAFQMSASNILFLVLLASSVTLLSAGEDFYALLGVDKGASVREIRRAFKKLAISKHPDKNVVSETDLLIFLTLTLYIYIYVIHVFIYY